MGRCSLGGKGFTTSGSEFLFKNFQDPFAAFASHFVVAGQEVPLSDFARIDGPFGRMEFDATALTIEHQGFDVALDFATWTRAASAPD